MSGEFDIFVQNMIRDKIRNNTIYKSWKDDYDTSIHWSIVFDSGYGDSNPTRTILYDTYLGVYECQTIKAWGYSDLSFVDDPFLKGLNRREEIPIGFRYLYRGVQDDYDYGINTQRGTHTEQVVSKHFKCCVMAHWGLSSDLVDEYINTLGG